MDRLQSFGLGTVSTLTLKYWWLLTWKKTKRDQNGAGVCEINTFWFSFYFSVNYSCARPVVLLGSQSWGHVATVPEQQFCGQYIVRKSDLAQHLTKLERQTLSTPDMFHFFKSDPFWMSTKKLEIILKNPKTASEQLNSWLTCQIRHTKDNNNQQSTIYHPRSDITKK